MPAVGVDVLDLRTVASANVEAVARQVPRVVDHEVVYLPNVTARQRAPIVVDAAVVRQTEHEIVRETLRGDREIAVARRLVVQRAHRVAHEAEAATVVLVAPGSREQRVAQLVGTGGEPDGEQPPLATL